MKFRIKKLRINIFVEKNDNKILFHINKNHESTTDITGDPIKGMIDLFEDLWEKQENLNLIATGYCIVYGEKNF